MALPTVKQLRYFVALAEHGHFGKAAADCFVSQSAFSTAIKELEETLGARLVDRTNRQVTITAIGQEIAVRARDCLGGLEQLVEIAQGQRKPLEAELRLGVIPTIAPFLLPRLLPRLRRAYPQLRLLLGRGVERRDAHWRILPRCADQGARMTHRRRAPALLGSAAPDPRSYRRGPSHPETGTVTGFAARRQRTSRADAQVEGPRADRRSPCPTRTGAPPRRW